jgi:hypothetical protein
MAQRFTAPAEIYQIHIRERLDPHWSELPPVTGRVYSCGALELGLG